MSTIIDYISNNIFGSFSNTPLYGTIFGVCAMTCLITFLLTDYVDNKPGVPEYITTLTIIACFVSFVIGSITLAVGWSGSNATARDVSVKTIGSAKTIGTPVATFNETGNTTVMELSVEANPVTLDVYDLPFDKPRDSYTIVKVTFKNHKKETYYAPIIKETYASDLAKELNGDPDTRKFLTETVTRLDEQKLKVTVSANKLKRSKTIKTATIAVTYSLNEKGKKAYEAYLDDPETLAAQRAKLRQDLRKAVDNDTLWE